MTRSRTPASPPGPASTDDVHAHANFIVTEPGARARDVRTLIERCRADVAARYGVTLVPEVVFLGERDA